MPHTNDKRIRQEVGRLLYLPNTAAVQVTHDGPVLDPHAPERQAFQALLLECLMSAQEHPHPLEQPRRAAMASISGYLNSICHWPDRLEIHTNTACRVASRLLPFHHEDHGVCGVPGLRPIGFTHCRVRLLHLPTRARLDLVDSSPWQSADMTRKLFRHETSWHRSEGRSPLWTQPRLTEREAAHQASWAFVASTPLRSALLMRAMPLWYRLGLAPAWIAGNATRPDRLTWDSHSDTDHSSVVDLLTCSLARIPGVRYRQKASSCGVLELDSGRVQLITNR